MAHSSITVWNLDILAQEFLDTNFYKTHPLKELNESEIQKLIFAQDQKLTRDFTPKDLTPYASFLAYLYQNSDYTIRWFYNKFVGSINHEEINFFKEQIPKIQNQEYFETPLNWKIFIECLWRCLENGGEKIAIEILEPYVDLLYQDIMIPFDVLETDENRNKHELRPRYKISCLICLANAYKLNKELNKCEEAFLKVMTNKDGTNFYPQKNRILETGVELYKLNPCKEYSELVRDLMVYKVTTEAPPYRDYLKETCLINLMIYRYLFKQEIN